ncbi:tetraacyldisaccharide 4'-kinase [Vaginella massiliensis]|uniref:tetraacyldisaccharide 4'-kinase n=1 Tax=Vaginella massiliensis TaxID=1816680 RepID=UPI0008399241|nr:tetraacyldisaccharide 4'-kinase [Vaginella massiliensis]
MNWRKFLLPLSGLYWIGTSFRNMLFNAGILKETSFDIPIINVGNLSVGGTGKSPHVMYLIELLKNKYKIATLSRGYGRKTKGFVFANYQTKVYDIGDEPMQFFRRFKNKIIVTVCEDRVTGANKLIRDFYPDAIVLDDAFQHRNIKPGLNILLTEYHQPYSQDYVLPAGNLREGSAGAKRADVVIVTKCPENLNEKEVRALQHDLKLKPNQELFFSKIVYDHRIYGLHGEIPMSEWMNYNVVLITGIAKADDFVAFCKTNFRAVLHLEYPDHHNFSDSEIDYIRKRYRDTEGDKLLLTTEKDYVRLLEEESLKNELYYLPIGIELNDPEKFNRLVLNYVSNNLKVK